MKRASRARASDDLWSVATPSDVVEPWPIDYRQSDIVDPWNGDFLHDDVVDPWAKRDAKKPAGGAAPKAPSPHGDVVDPWADDVVDPF